MDNNNNRFVKLNLKYLEILIGLGVFIISLFSAIFYFKATAYFALKSIGTIDLGFFGFDYTEFNSTSITVSTIFLKIFSTVAILVLIVDLFKNKNTKIVGKAYSLVGMFLIVFAGGGLYVVGAILGFIGSALYLRDITRDVVLSEEAFDKFTDSTKKALLQSKEELKEVAKTASVKAKEASEKTKETLKNAKSKKSDVDEIIIDEDMKESKNNNKTTDEVIEIVEEETTEEEKKDNK